MDTLEKTEITTSIRHIVRSLKSGIPTYNPEVPAFKKIKKKKTKKKTKKKAIAKRFAFHANAMILSLFYMHKTKNLRCSSEI